MYITKIWLFLWVSTMFMVSGSVWGQIIDHTCTDINLIPHEYLEKIRNNLRISYGHAAHGGQIIAGMEALSEANPVLFRFSTDRDAVHPGALSLWDRIPPGDLGSPNRTNWADFTERLLDGPGKDRNVVVWAWCNQVSDASRRDIQTYLKLMGDLEKKYPDVKFVYMTGHLDGTGENGNLNRRNDQIREHCRRHGKILFDFAAIESFAPGSDFDYMKAGGNDNCDYVIDGRRGNWALEWIERNPGHNLILPSSAPQTHPLNALLKGRAFWWMLAVIAGWEPPPERSTALTPPPRAAAPSATVPPPAPGISRIYRFEQIQDYRPWVLFGSSEPLIPESGTGLHISPGAPAVAMYRGLYSVGELEFKVRLLSGANVSWYINTDWTDTWNPAVGIGGIADEKGCLLLINGEVLKLNNPVRLGSQEHRFQITIRNNQLIWGIDKHLIVRKDIPPALAERKGSMAIGGWNSSIIIGGVYFQAR